jgi:hypothetical protein
MIAGFFIVEALLDFNGKFFVGIQKLLISNRATYCLGTVRSIHCRAVQVCTECTAALFIKEVTDILGVTPNKIFLLCRVALII